MTNAEGFKPQSQNLKRLWNSRFCVGGCHKIQLGRYCGDAVCAGPTFQGKGDAHCAGIAAGEFRIFPDEPSGCGNAGVLEKMRGKMEQLAGTASGREELKEFFGVKGGDKLAAALLEFYNLKKNISQTPLFSQKDIEALDKLDKLGKEGFRRGQVGLGRSVGDVSTLFGPDQSAKERITALHDLMNRPAYAFIASPSSLKVAQKRNDSCFWPPPRADSCHSASWVKADNLRLLDCFVFA